MTQDIDARLLQYTRGGERGVQLFEYANGSRSSIARMERVFEQTQPGPQNLQSWAVDAWNNGLGRVK